MTIAFQWNVTSGLLDGSTAFEWPDALPVGEGQSVLLPQGGTCTLTNGVYVMDMESGDALGTIPIADIPAPFTTSDDWWIASSHITCPSACRSARVSTDPVDANFGGLDLFPPPMSDSTSGAICHHGLRGVKTESRLPRGARLVLTSNNAPGFTGPTSVSGNYRFYLELGRSSGAVYRGKVQRVIEAAYERAQADMISFSQATAASEVISYTATKTCKLVGVLFSAGAVPAAGESMQVLTRRALRSSATTQTIGTAKTINNSNYTTANALLGLRQNDSTGNIYLEAGDRLEVVLTYAAGGGPTPMADISLTFMLQEVDTWAVKYLNPAAYLY